MGKRLTSFKEIDKLFSMVQGHLNEGSIEVRYWAKKTILALSKSNDPLSHPEIEKLLKRHFSSQNYPKAKAVIDKGYVEEPTEMGMTESSGFSASSSNFKKS